MIRRLSSAAVLVPLLVLAACGGEVISGNIHRAGAPEHFAASGGRDLKTVIIGNPFAQPKAQVDAAIVAAMQGHHPGPRTRFATTPDASAVDVYRIAIMFDPPRMVDSGTLCGDVSTLKPEAAGGIRLLAVFCADEAPITSVDAMIPKRSATADDAAVRRLVAHVMWELIPAADPLALFD